METNRSRLALGVSTVLIVLGCTDSADVASVERCADLASPRVGENGVYWDDLDPTAALPACDQAVKERPSDSRIQFLYARALSKAERHEEALSWYRKAIDQEYAPAQNALGFMYASGYGVVRNDDEAVVWYRKAADQGDALAQANLAFMHEAGRSVAKDDEKAAALYLMAAKQGNAYAQDRIGWMNQNGIGLPKNEAEAVEWYRKAAEQGYAQAQNNLGFMYGAGVGVKRDVAEAIGWYRKAAEQDHAFAQYNLGVMYARGDGVPKSVDEAIVWYRKAAANGHEDAKKQVELLGKESKQAERSYAGTTGRQTMPELGIAIEVPYLAGCYSPIEFDPNDLEREPRRIGGPTLEYRFQNGWYSIYLDGNLFGKAQFAPFAGIAHSSESHPNRNGGAVGTNIAIETPSRMRDFMQGQYKEVIADSRYVAVQLIMAAVHSRLPGPDGSGAGSYDYYIFNLNAYGESQNFLFAVPLDLKSEAAANVAGTTGIQIGGIPGSPVVAAESEAQLYEFFGELEQASDSLPDGGFAYLSTECPSVPDSN